MWQERAVSNSRRWHGGEQNDRNRMRDNLLAAIIIALLLATGACLANELLEASETCHGSDGGCAAWGVPTGQVSFSEFFQQ